MILHSTLLYNVLPYHILFLFHKVPPYKTISHQTLFVLMDALDHVMDTSSMSVVPFMDSGFRVHDTQVEVWSNANTTKTASLNDSQIIISVLTRMISFNKAITKHTKVYQQWIATLFKSRFLQFWNVSWSNKHRYAKWKWCNDHTVAGLWEREKG